MHRATVMRVYPRTDSARDSPCTWTHASSRPRHAKALVSFSLARTDTEISDVTSAESSPGTMMLLWSANVTSGIGSKSTKPSHTYPHSCCRTTGSHEK